jgi:hypothetical protein
MWRAQVTAGEVAQFRLLSMEYRAAVWTVLLVCERCAADAERGGRGFAGVTWMDKVAAAPYGEVPIELWMLIFGFCRRNVPVQHMIA